jgi:chromosome partitioning protein
MAKIACFANSKGGVGKTTSCLAVGTCLADLGYKTLLIDLDHQGNLSDDVGRGDEDYTITDLFEDPKFDITKLVYPALNREETIENLDVIPADITLATEARAAERYRHRLQILSDGLKPIKDSYDFILIDCRPAIDLSIENALLITDIVIVPVDMDRRATKGISDLFEVISEIKRNDKFDYMLLKTKIDARNSIMLKATNERIDSMDLLVSDTVIRTSEDFKKATEEKMPICYYAKNSKSHQDYMNFTNELLDHMEISGERYKKLKAV